MHKTYRDAGYHRQTWNTPTKTSPLVGIHDTEDGEIVVEHLAAGPSGLPELKLSHFRRTEVERPVLDKKGEPTGELAIVEEHVLLRGVTVCCEDVAREYLDQFGATRKSRRRKAGGDPPKVDLGHWKER